MRTPGPAPLPPEIAKGATPATAYGRVRLPPVTLRVSGVLMRRGSHGEPRFFGKRLPRDSRLSVDVAQRLGSTPRQVALAWLLRCAPNILLIPGTSSVAPPNT